MLRLIADGTRRGRVVAMDLQKDALQNTSSVTAADERGLVDIYGICHTKMEDLVSTGATVRLVAFNLGYLPGGDKKIKTESETTLLALEAAKRIGLISILAYVGHSGGRDELEKVECFAGELLQMLNWPSAPVLVLCQGNDRPLHLSCTLYINPEKDIGLFYDRGKFYFSNPIFEVVELITRMFIRYCISPNF